MNQIPATVTSLERFDHISVAGFEANGVGFLMMALDLEADLEIGSRVVLGVKSTNVALAKEFSGSLSTSNQIPVRIVEIFQGELLCSVTLAFDSYRMESIITRKSVERMQLKEGETVTALVKASELFITGQKDV